MQAAAGLAGATLLHGADGPAATVAVTRCRSYTPAEVTAVPSPQSTVPV